MLLFAALQDDREIHRHRRNAVEPGGTVNGYAVQITNQIATGDVFMGNFADLLIGMWGGLDLMVDPYTHSKRGRVRVVVFQDVDFALRREESFCLGRKPVTT
jgi:hypothetical protein